MNRIYKSFINGAPWILLLALIMALIETPINGWKVAFTFLAFGNSVRYLIDYENDHE